MLVVIEADVDWPEFRELLAELGGTSRGLCECVLRELIEENIGEFLEKAEFTFMGLE